MRRLAHALVPARDHDVAVADPDRLVAQSHGTQPGAAELIDPVRGAFHRDPGVHRGLPGRILSRPGREDLTHDDFVDLVGGDRSPAHRFLDRDLAEIVRWYR